MNFDKEPNEELFNMWTEMLEDYDPYYIQVAIDNIIKNDKFFPAFNRILEEIKNLPPIEIPEEEKIKRMKAKRVKPEWLGKEIENQPIDDETENIFSNFQNFIKEFREN